MPHRLAASSCRNERERLQAIARRNVPGFWNRDRSAYIVHIDFEPAEIDSHYDVTLDIQADIADALWQTTRR